MVEITPNLNFLHLKMMGIKILAQLEHALEKFYKNSHKIPKKFFEDSIKIWLKIS